MMDFLVSELHWFAEGIKSGSVTIKESHYNSSYSDFVQNYEEWLDDLTEYDGWYEYKCETCNTVNVLPFGEWDCEACNHGNDESYTIEKWDKLSDKVTIICKRCGSKYYISCDDAEREIFDCFECYKKTSRPYICPICSKKTSNIDFCETCGFPIYDAMKRKDQTYYTVWLKNTVIPSKRIWNKIAPQYIKTLNDLSTSLGNETKLLQEERALLSQLSQCRETINRLNQRISELEGELKYKNAKIDSAVSMLTQSLDNSSTDNVLNLPIEKINLSIRTFNCLHRAGIKTVRDLANMELRKIRFLGKNGYQEIVQVAAAIGISLKP